MKGDCNFACHVTKHLIVQFVISNNNNNNNNNNTYTAPIAILLSSSALENKNISKKQKQN